MNEVIDRLRQELAHFGYSHCEDDVRTLISEFESLQEAHNRMSEIYRLRGETIAEMRRLLDKTS